MIKKYGKIFHSLVIYFFIIISIIISNLTIRADESETKKIRVAYPLQPGLTGIDEDGNFNGYTYDYLQEVAQYLGWEYEFVVIEGELNQALLKTLDMLEKGEVDLVGGMRYIEELTQIYEYAEHSYGTANGVIAVLNDNVSINETTFTMMKHCRLGVLEVSERYQKELDNISSSYGMEIELVKFNSDNEMEKALKQHKIDAILSMDMGLQEDTRVVAKFAPVPFYFAAPKGETDIINELDIGIQTINSTSPTFSSKLYEKYFGTGNKQSQLFFNEEEKEFIRNSEVIRVGFTNARAPLQYYDEETKTYKGIMIDYLNALSEKTGLNFQYIGVDKPEELIALAQKGEIDVLASIITDYDLAKEYNVSLSHPILSTPITIALNNKVDGKHLKNAVLALPKGFQFENDAGSEIVWYDTIQECLEAVNKGIAGYCVGNSYAIQYYANYVTYHNILLWPQSIYTQNISLGIVRPMDKNFLSTINKAIDNFPLMELEAIIYKNTSGVRKTMTMADLFISNPKEIIIGILSFATIIIFILGWNLWNRTKMNRRIQIENERYSQLSLLSDECFFEYDFLKDKVELSENGAQILGMDRVIENFMVKLRKLIHDGESELQILYDYVTGETKETPEFLYTVACGQKQWIRIIAKRIQDSSGKTVYLIGKIINIQKEKEKQELLLKQAQTDSLTKIFNIATVKELIAEYLSEENNQGTLLILDIDYFKMINDTYGHYTGDQVLIEVAEVLKFVFRQDDIIGRLGGDEFVVFMKRVHEQKTVSMKCRQLLERLAQIKVIEELPRITTSIGAAFTMTNECYDDLYKRADKGLYIVKKNGRNDFHLVTEETENKE